MRVLVVLVMFLGLGPKKKHISRFEKWRMEDCALFGGGWGTCGRMAEAELSCSICNTEGIEKQERGDVSIFQSDPERLKIVIASFCIKVLEAHQFERTLDKRTPALATPSQAPRCQSSPIKETCSNKRWRTHELFQRTDFWNISS